MKHTLGSLFVTFLKIGAFTFGGGYAMIALLEDEFVARRSWLSREEFLDMVAIAESTPGPLAVNSATFIGYRLAGLPGAALSTVAVALPSLLIIYLISLFFDRFLSLTLVGYAFRGVQACVIYLIFSAGVRLLKGLKRDGFSALVLVAVFALSLGFSLCAVRFSSVFFVLICGGLGVLAGRLSALRRKDGEAK